MRCGRRRAGSALPWVCLVALGGACGSSGPPSATGPAAGATFSGRITYDARHPTTQGASAEVEERPARKVDVALLGPSGEVISEGRTTERGRFSLEGPADAARLRIYARVRVDGREVAISNDANGRDVHVWDIPLGGPDEPVQARAVDGDGHAGAFHVLDTLHRGLATVSGWTGRDLPPLYAYWVRGGTREWSFYRGERPHGSGRYALELLGGDPGQQSITDTDEHDEAIVLHELGHFVMDRLSSDSSTGGMHPTGARIDPGLAWEEGRATWFALSVLGAPIYRDTIGVQPWGRLRVDEDMESDGGPEAVHGLGSETSVTRVLWDLVDGVEGVPDHDDDGVALGPAAVLEAMIEQAARPGAFPALPSFLRYLIEQGVVEEAALRRMLARTNQPADELIAAPDSSPWPTDVSVGATVTGTIDGLTQPAPSGGPNLAPTGFDAIDTYRVRVEEPGMLMLRLHIDGSGQVADRSDLDLELLDLRADRLATARTEAPLETVGHLVQPGWYIVRVRDGGRGNRADYRLEVLLETLGGPPLRR